MEFFAAHFYRDVVAANPTKDVPFVKLFRDREEYVTFSPTPDCTYMHIRTAVQSGVDEAVENRRLLATRTALELLARLFEKQKTDSWPKVMRTVVDGQTALDFIRATNDDPSASAQKESYEMMLTALYGSGTPPGGVNKLTIIQDVVNVLKMPEFYAVIDHGDKRQVFISLLFVYAMVQNVNPTLLRLGAPVMVVNGIRDKASLMEDMFRLVFEKAMAHYRLQREHGEPDAVEPTATSLIEGYIKVFDIEYGVIVAGLAYGVKVYRDCDDKLHAVLPVPWSENRTDVDNGLFVLMLEYLLHLLNVKTGDSELPAKIGDKLLSNALRNVPFTSTLLNVDTFVRPICGAAYDIVAKCGGTVSTVVDSNDVYDFVYIPCIRHLMGDRRTEVLVALNKEVVGQISDASFRLTDYVRQCAESPDIGLVPTTCFVRVYDSVAQQQRAVTGVPDAGAYWMGFSWWVSSAIRNSTYDILEFLVDNRKPTPIVSKNDKLPLFHARLPVAYQPTNGEALLTNTQLMNSLFNINTLDVARDAFAVLVCDAILQHGYSWEKTLMLLCKMWQQQLASVQEYTAAAATKHAVSIQLILENVANLADATGGANTWSREELLGFVNECCADKERVRVVDALVRVVTVSCRVLYDSMDCCNWLIPIVDNVATITDNHRLVARSGVAVGGGNTSVWPLYWLVKQETGGGGDIRYDVINTELWRGTARTKAISHHIHELFFNNRTVAEVDRAVSWIESLYSDSTQSPKIYFREAMSWGIKCASIVHRNSKGAFVKTVALACNLNRGVVSGTGGGSSGNASLEINSVLNVFTSTFLTERYVVRKDQRLSTGKRL
jgi:hypothetical protein